MHCPEPLRLCTVRHLLTLCCSIIARARDIWPTTLLPCQGPGSHGALANSCQPKNITTAFRSGCPDWDSADGSSARYLWFRVQGTAVLLIGSLELGITFRGRPRFPGLFPPSGAAALGTPVLGSSALHRIVTPSHRVMSNGFILMAANCVLTYNQGSSGRGSTQC